MMALGPGCRRGDFCTGLRQGGRLMMLFAILRIWDVSLSLGSVDSRQPAWATLSPALAPG